MCAVNNGGDDANETKAHRDLKKYRKGYNCIISGGDYSGGALVLFELRIMVEMKAGDIILLLLLLLQNSFSLILPFVLSIFLSR